MQAEDARPDESRSHVADRTVPRWPGVAAFLVAIALGLLIGLWIERDDGAAHLVADGSDLTERQADMLDIAERYGDAWRANDRDTMAASMTPNGVIRYPQNGWEFSPSDGTLGPWIANERYRTLELWPRQVVDEDRIVLFGEVESEGVRWISIVEFTSTGDPLIISETIHWWK